MCINSKNTLDSYEVYYRNITPTAVVVVSVRYLLCMVTASSATFAVGTSAALTWAFCTHELPLRTRQLLRDIYLVLLLILILILIPMPGHTTRLLIIVHE